VVLRPTQRRRVGGKPVGGGSTVANANHRDWGMRPAATAASFFLARTCRRQVGNFRIGGPKLVDAVTVPVISGPAGKSPTPRGIGRRPCAGRGGGQSALPYLFLPEAKCPPLFYLGPGMAPR